MVAFAWYFIDCYRSDPMGLKNVEVISYAQVAVRHQLKSPSTAKFPIGGTCSPTGTPGQYRVTGQVDAQNSFGAMLRSDWVVVLHKEGATWVTDSVQVH